MTGAGSIVVGDEARLNRLRADGFYERAEPPFFSDFNLDQVVESITASCAEYNLKPFFYKPLRDVEAVQYRHAVLRDLERDAVFESVRAFAQQMRSMREHLAQADKLHYQYPKERWFLDAVGIYCHAVSSLTDELTIARRELAAMIPTASGSGSHGRPPVWPVASPQQHGDKGVSLTSLSLTSLSLVLP